MHVCRFLVPDSIQQLLSSMICRRIPGRLWRESCTAKQARENSKYNHQMCGNHLREEGCYASQNMLLLGMEEG